MERSWAQPRAQPGKGDTEAWPGRVRGLRWESGIWNLRPKVGALGQTLWGGRKHPGHQAPGPPAMSRELRPNRDTAAHQVQRPSSAGHCGGTVQQADPGGLEDNWKVKGRKLRLSQADPAPGVAPLATRARSGHSSGGLPHRSRVPRGPPGRKASNQKPRERNAVPMQGDGPAEKQPSPESWLCGAQEGRWQMGAAGHGPGPGPRPGSPRAREQIAEGASLPRRCPHGQAWSAGAPESRSLISRSFWKLAERGFPGQGRRWAVGVETARLGRKGAE